MSFLNNIANSTSAMYITGVLIISALLLIAMAAIYNFKMLPNAEDDFNKAIEAAKDPNTISRVDLESKNLATTKKITNVLNVMQPIFSILTFLFVQFMNKYSNPLKY